MFAFEDFIQVCVAFDDSQSNSTSKDGVRAAVVQKDGRATYRTTARDQDNYKETVTLVWDEATGKVEFDGGWPETGDEIENILKTFAPEGTRRFTLYAKIRLPAASLGQAEKAVVAVLRTHPGWEAEISDNGRTVQFL